MTISELIFVIMFLAQALNSIKNIKMSVIKGSKGRIMKLKF